MTPCKGSGVYISKFYFVFYSPPLHTSHTRTHKRFRIIFFRENTRSRVNVSKPSVFSFYSGINNNKKRNSIIQRQKTTPSQDFYLFICLFFSLSLSLSLSSNSLICFELRLKDTLSRYNKSATATPYYTRRYNKSTRTRFIRPTHGTARPRRTGVLTRFACVAILLKRITDDVLCVNVFVCAFCSCGVSRHCTLVEWKTLLIWVTLVCQK